MRFPLWPIYYGLVITTLLGAIIVDFTVPVLYRAALYAIPLLIAGLALPSRHVGIVFIITIVAGLIGSFGAETPNNIRLLRIAALLFFGFLCFMLSRERERASEQGQRATNILESMSDAFYALNAHWRFTYVNKEGEHLLRRSRQQLTGKVIWEEYPQVVDTESYHQYHKVMAQKIAVAFETYYEPLQTWFDVRAYPTAEGISVYLEDINERKRAEAESERLLRDIDAQRKLFEAVINTDPSQIALLRWPDLTYKVANGAYRATAPNRPMLGHPLTEVFPEILDQLRPIIEKVMLTGEPYHADDVPLLIGGTHGEPVERRYFSFSYLRVSLSESEKYLLSVGIETTKQVHDRQKIEELAETAQNRASELRGIIDSIVDAVIVVDTKLRLTLANERAYEQLGLRFMAEREILASNFPAPIVMRYLSGPPVNKKNDPLVRALHGQVIEGEDVNAHDRRSGQDKYFRISAAPVRKPTGEIIGAVLVARDISELIEIDKMKDDFIRVAAHELKTPIAIMKGYAQALKKAKKITPEKQSQMLDAVDRGADRLTKIVENLLDVSQLQSGEMKFARDTVDMSKLVPDVVHKMAPLAPHHQLLITNGQPAVVKADRERLEGVIVHLVENAIKYSPAGGHIEVAENIAHGEVVVSVTDHGIGIPKDKQRRMFERFYRAHLGTSHDYGGMGVGLYIAREIIQALGGKMWFHSEEGKGSTFYFRLPLLTRTEPPTRPTIEK